jgi:O-methyltransferase
MVTRNRRRKLLSLMKELDDREVPGDVVELGVFKGGTAGVLGSACADSPFDRHLWLYDSYQGLPEPLPEDGPEAEGWAQGETGGRTIPINGCVGTRTEVENFLFEEMGLNRQSVTLIEGWYQDTLADAKVESVGLLHVDCDWYESVKLSLDAFYDQVAAGGCIVLDDYGRWPGAKQALDEALAERKVSPEIHRVGSAQAYFWKP